VDAIRHQNRKLFAAITGGDIRRTQIQCHRRRRCAKAVIARPQIRRALPADFPTEGLGVFGDRDRMAKARLRGSRLGYLLNGAGFFHQPHRAVDDCHALLEILSFELPTTGTSALAVLLERARKKTLRLWAEQPPIDLKDVLKRRSYRWSDGGDGRPRSWYVDLHESWLDDEIAFLKTEIYLVT